jgi:hypothetical protein
MATKAAVVLSQARGNGVYPHFSEDTCPAVPAREPAVTSPCRASLKACPGTLSRTEPHPTATIPPAAAAPWRVRGFARSRGGWS